MKTIIYWSPYLGHIGTKKSTLNSALGLISYGKSVYNVRLINSLGEWEEASNLKRKNFETVNFNRNYYKSLPKGGFIKSRISFIVFFILSFMPLLNFLKKEKPDFLIAHLVTSLPIFLFSIFNFRTKLILRISGYPQLNFIRKTFWKICSKNIHKITCPSKELKSKLVDLNIFDKNKIEVLYDSVISYKNIIKKKSGSIENNLNQTPFLLSIGRITKQKNFPLLVDAFFEIRKNNKNLKLLIIGEGEDKNQLVNQIKKKGLENSIELIGFQNNVYKFFENSIAFVLPSLWEEMGFVIIEAASCNTIIISSNCPNGPSEFLNYGEAGYLFKNNSKEDLVKKINQFLNDKDKSIKQKKISAKRNTKNFTVFNHFKQLETILSS